MHDPDTSSFQPSATRQDTTTVRLPQQARLAPPDVSAGSAQDKRPGLFARAVQWLARLFSSRRAVQGERTADPQAAERAAAARAAQMPEPVAFVSDTTSTLVTPMGAYAGKPVEQAMRKRAEQQFRMMDVTQATMN